MKNKQYEPEVEAALGMWVKLARAFAVFNKRTSEHIRHHGLTASQFGALECLGHLGPMTIGGLSKKMLVSGGNMTVVIDNLEKENLVERVRDKSDRRAVHVQLTKKGRRVFNKVFPEHAEYVTKLVSVLSPEEQEALAGLLKKLGLAIQ